MDRDASGAGLSFPECPDSAGIAWQPKQYVLTKRAFLSTMADLLVSMLTSITDSAPCITFLFISPSTSPPHVSIFNSS